MKRILLSIIILSVLCTITACNSTNKETPSLIKQVQTQQFTYTITSIEGNNIYGTATDGTGIYFTSNYTKDKLKVNDTVTAYFSTSEPDSLVRVEKE